MSDEVRERLLQQGVLLFREHGYHATGIQQIATAAGIPKGSFHYYFESKEAFALAVIDRYATKIVAGIRVYLERTTLPPLVRLRAYFENGLASMDVPKGGHGCAVGNLLAELGDTNDILQAALAAAWERIAAALEAFLAEAQRDGTLSPEADGRRVAGLLLSGWEGALIAMRAQRSTSPLAAFLDLVFEPLLAGRRKS
ncbi:TetR family transcriptional regulator C-terminal domain-containing protein [Candidatus Bipolaricaulota bacterium]